MQRVLIVEDEGLVYDAIRAALAFKGGFEVEHAGDGMAGLAALRRAAPDLALIDVMLPKLSGDVVAEEAASRRVPVILMSGHPEVITRPQAYRFPILAKPFRLSYLLERLEPLLAEAARLRTADAIEVQKGRELIRRRQDAQAEERFLAERAAEQWRQSCDALLRDRDA